MRASGQPSLRRWPNTSCARREYRATEAVPSGIGADDLVSVDEKVFNAARIWKVYGTIACKAITPPNGRIGWPSCCECLTGSRLYRLTS